MLLYIAFLVEVTVSLFSHLFFNKDEVKKEVSPTFFEGLD